MKVRWLIPNNAYAILSKGEIVDLDGKRFFDTLDEVRDHLKLKGLTLKNRAVVKAAR